MSIPVLSTAIAVASGMAAYQTLSPILRNQRKAETWPVTKGVVLGVICLNATRRTLDNMGSRPGEEALPTFPGSVDTPRVL